MSPLPFADDPLEEEPGLGGPPLSAYVDMLRRRLWLIVACVLAALLAAGVVTWLSTPMYRATTLLNLDPQGASSFEVAGTPARTAAPDAGDLRDRNATHAKPGGRRAGRRRS